MNLSKMSTIDLDALLTVLERADDTEQIQLDEIVGVLLERGTDYARDVLTAHGYMAPKRSP